MFGKKHRQDEEAVAPEAAGAAGEPLAPEGATETGGDGEDVFVNKVARLEDVVSQKTKELENARSQLQELSAAHSEASEIEMDDANLKEAEALLERPNEGKAEAVAELETGTLVTDDDAEIAEPDDGDDLFGMEEEEENPLVGLIASLPEVTVDELMQDMADIKEILAKMHSGGH